MAYIDILAIFIAFLIGIITYFKWAFTYWKRRNLPSLEPTIPFGNLENPFTKRHSPVIAVENRYDEFKSKGCKHGGTYIFTVSRYMPIDPEFVKNVLQKDFQYFTDRGFYFNEKDDPLSGEWRNLRTKITPTFTSGKMKMMFDTLVQCGHQMLEAMDGYYKNNEAIDIKEVLARYTTDVIGSCNFGLECNSFKGPDAECRKHGKKIFGPLSKTRNAWLLLTFSTSVLGRFLRIPYFPKKTFDFFMSVVKETVKYREINGIDRKGMLKLLIDIKNSENGNGLTIEELAAQAFVFFFAGFETSSTTITFCFYELAKKPDIQDKVRTEVNRVLNNHEGKISYDAMMDMKYMNQVIDETLRKYPPLPFITREAVKDYYVPDTDVVVPKGVSVTILIMVLHYDSEHYPGPEKFDPERFSEENKQKRHTFTDIPFGEEPRVCIGLRVGLMQAKVGLSLLLKYYKFSLSKKTVHPIVMDPYSFILTSETGIFLDVEKV